MLDSIDSSPQYPFSARRFRSGPIRRSSTNKSSSHRNRISLLASARLEPQFVSLRRISLCPHRRRKKHHHLPPQKFFSVSVRSTFKNGNISWVQAGMALHLDRLCTILGFLRSAFFQTCITTPRLSRHHQPHFPCIYFLRLNKMGTVSIIIFSGAQKHNLGISGRGSKIVFFALLPVRI